MSRQRTIVLGLGITGMSCVRFLHGRDELTVVDTRETPPGLEELCARFPDVPVQTGASTIDFSGADRIIVSPGIGLDDPILAGMPPEVQFLSDIDLFCEAAVAPVLAVTGTNGKSTVTALTGHILAETGCRVMVGGNLGDAALDLLDDEIEAYVLELSSFQLERMVPHHFKAATVLNITEDHLDRHGDMADYTATKRRIYEDCEICLANRDDVATLPDLDCALVTFGGGEPECGHWGVRSLSDVRWLTFGDEPVVRSDALPIAGRHNELNVLAAMALADAAGVSRDAMADVVQTFSTLPHRCERVGVLAGVEFIDDSKATNVGATRAALLGLGDPAESRIVLIAGGDGKGADFSSLRDVVAQFVKALVLLGRDGPVLAEALQGCAAIHRADDMSEAVALAADLASSGDLVLLSPACASFDMYENFSARGRDFSRAVEALAA